jgi:regulator of RNase E activity RraA
MHGLVVELIDRVEGDVLEAFRRHATATVADALGGFGVVNHEVRALTRGMRVCGPAVTVWTRPGDALFSLKASDVVQQGDVVVIDAAGVKDVGSVGEIFAEYLQSVGVCGLVVDGAIRDSAGIAQAGFPTFARAACPRFYGLNGPGAINVPIQCGGVLVNPGDLVLGDDDGLVVVPRTGARTVLSRVESRMAAEVEWRKQLAEGRTIVEIYDIDSRIAAAMTPLDRSASDSRVEV